MEDIEVGGSSTRAVASPSVRWGMAVLRFLIWGVPGFIVALCLNATLVKLLGWPFPIAYAVALGVQLSINFVVCRVIVFPGSEPGTVVKQIGLFTGTSVLIRFVDLGVYSLITALLEIHFLIVQACNVLLFAVVRYSVVKWIFSPK